MSGYDYGNARLRARRGLLLRREQYAMLAGRDLPGLLAALAATSYRPQAAAAAGAPGSPLAVLYRVAAEHLTAALADIAGFYRDPAAGVVAALLGRFDLHNTLTVLRAAHHGNAGPLVAPALVRVGRISERTAREAAAQPDLPAAARFLAARDLPDPDTAATLVTVAREYEREPSLAAAEHAVTSSARARQLRVLAGARRAAAPAVAALQRETNDLNLLLALRGREAAGGPAATASPPALPDGTLPAGLLAAVRHAATRADAAAAAVPGAARWQAPLAAWVEHGDLARLHAALDRERTRTELRRLRGTEPLGAGPVLHHVLAEQAQARNIRLLAQAAAGLIGRDVATRHLVTPV